MKQFLIKSVLFSLIFFGIGFVFLYFAKAWLPDSNGLIAQNSDVLTA